MTGPPRPASDEEILALLVEQRLQRLLSKFGSEALAWLAVTPTWTEPAASATSFPSQKTPLKEFLDEASEQGLVDRDPPLRSDPDLGRGFWISEKDRQPVLEFLRHHTGFGAAKLTEVTVQIALRLEQAKDSTPLPDELRYWSELAKRAREPFAVARQLGDDVTALTRDKKTGEAVGRLDAGRSLAQTLGTDKLDPAISVSSRRIGLAYRQAADDRHLKRYFPRDEQHKAFKALLDENSPAWALHYLGVGGAGKTMLMRWITTPPKEDRPAGRERVVSRIDFDDLKPEYPVRKPGQLLLDLAVELRRFGQSTQEEFLFKAIQDAVIDQHALLSVAPPPSNPLFNVERPEFNRILVPFCDLVSVLPPPVVLILDTCEELARVPVVQGILPSVEATFSILERVHQKVPSMRVVFAGRRPIASSGHLWKLREAGTPEGDRGFRQFLRQRKYLAIHEVRGVNRSEAQVFLEARAGRPLPDDLEDAVFDRSRDPGRAADIVQIHRGIVPAGSGPRYSLFDLALYGDWLREDPTLDAQRIASSTSDPYVDLRIVQRVKQPLIRAALPAVAALGRFDAPMVRGAFPASLTDGEYQEIYRQLGDYEWLELQRESGTERLFLEVDRNLLPRIRSYYDHVSRRSEAATARAGLVPDLSSFLRRTRLGDLSATHLSAALAILQPPAAARLWVEGLLRVRSQADLNWLRTTTERLMGVEFETARHGALQRGLELAAESVALLSGTVRHRAPREVPQRNWPDEATADWIARCSDATGSERSDRLDALVQNFTFVPKAPEPVLGPDRMPDNVLARRMSEEEAAAIVGALEHHVGVLPPPSRLEPRFRGVTELAGAVAAWASALRANDYPAALVGMAQMLTAKLWAAAWNVNDAREWAERALKTAASASDDSDGLWLFWRAPEAWCDRIRHELLLLHEDVQIEAFPDPAGWLAGALSRNASIDGERLASAIERHLLDRALPEPTELHISEAADKYAVERVPATSAHRRTPGLFVTLAMKRAALGDFNAADAALQARALEAEKTPDPDTVLEATLARVDVACLSREVPRELPSVVKRLTRDLKQRVSAEKVFALKALAGMDVTDGFAGTAHDIWRTQYYELATDRRKALADVERLRAFVLPPGELPAPPPPRVALADALDGIEFVRLALEDEVTLRIQPPSQTTYVVDGEDLIRGMLRLYALHPIPNDQLSSRIDVSGPLDRLLLGVSAPPRGRVERNDLVDLVRQIAKTTEREMLNARASGQDAQYDPEGIALRLVSHFGIRRWTALAQQEGELLALRLPQEGGRLLQLAEALAKATSDPQAAIAAATAASLAVFRTLTHERQAAVYRAQADAWTLATGADGWQAIQRVALEIADEARWTAESGTQGALPARGGWIARAVLSLVARSVNVNQRAWSSAGDRVLRSFPHQAMAPEIALAVRTSVEPMPVEEDTPAPAPPREVSQLVAAFPLLMTVAFGVVLVALWIYLVRINAFGATGTPTPLTFPFLAPLVIGTLATGLLAFATGGPSIRTIVPALLVMFVALCFCYWFVGFVADLLIPDSLIGGRLSQSWRVILMLVVVGGATAFEPVFRTARASLARGSEASIWINSASSHADLRTELGSTSSIELQLSCRSRGLTFPFFTWQSETYWSRTVEMSAVQPYAATTATIDAADVRPFVDLREILRQELWPVPIESGAASYQPWEGVLGLAVAGVEPDSTPKTGEPVFFYRWGPRRSTARPDAWAVGHVQVLGAPESDVWANRAIPRAPSNWLGIGSPLRTKTYTIVHAIGTPVVTSYGPRLEFGDRSGFLDAQMLPERLPLLILQQQPADSQARVTSDREQAAVLRAVAADLFESTCDAVIVIPSLPPELADRVIRKIAASVSTRYLVFHWLDGWVGSNSDRQRSHMALARLATAVRSARDLVLGPDGFERFATRLTDINPRLDGDRWLGREVAWDLCLFARPRDPGGAIEMQRARHT